jgi:hypothetical protein
MACHDLLPITQCQAPHSLASFRINRGGVNHPLAQYHFNTFLLQNRANTLCNLIGQWLGGE